VFLFLLNASWGREPGQERSLNFNVERGTFPARSWEDSSWRLSAGGGGVSFAVVKEKRNVVWPIVLMLVFASTRWPGVIPADWVNFSAAYALLFCAGVYLPAKLAWWLPLATMLGTGMLLNYFQYHLPVFNAYMLVTLGAYAAIVWIGRRFNARDSWFRLLGGGLLGAVVFYLISNTAAWGWESTQPYAKTFSGWLQALTVGTAGWPETWKFFRNTLLSGGLFTGLFVGAMKWAESREASDERAEAPAEEESAVPEAEAEVGR
jgi:hypothetical protein